MPEPGGQQPAPTGGEPAAPAVPAAAPAAPAATPATPAVPAVEPGVATSSSPPTDEHWINGIPEGTFDERDSTVLKRFGTIPDLAKGYMNAFNLVSRDKIPMPQSPDEFSEVYDRLGRPKDVAEYELPVAEDAPTEFKTLMASNQDWFRQIAHKVGLNKSQAKNMYGEYAGLVLQQTKANQDRIASEMETASTALKTELGDAYEGKMTLANRAITEVGGEDLINLFETSGMGRNPTVVKAFIKIGELMAEEVNLDIDGKTTDTQSDLDAQIAEIQANKAYLNAKEPEHKILVEKMAKLMARRHPEVKQPAGTIRLF